MYNRNFRFRLTNFGQIDSSNWSRSSARKSSDPRYSEHQINVNQPTRPESAAQVRVASPRILTQKILLKTIRILPTKDIHDLINELIEELDARSNDPDVEAEPTEDDDESEAEAVEDDDESEFEPVEDDEALVPRHGGFDGLVVSG